MHTNAIIVQTGDSHIDLDLPNHVSRGPEVLVRGRTIRKTNKHRGIETAKYSPKSLPPGAMLLFILKSPDTNVNGINIRAR